MKPCASRRLPQSRRRKPHTFTHHGMTVADDYAWLRDPGYPEVTDKEVLAHLEAENAWFEARMAPHKARIDALFKEMRGRIKEADKSVPQKDGDWLYWIEFEEGAEYKKWWRRPVAAPGRWQCRRTDPGRSRAGRGQGIFPPRRDFGQPPTASCWPIRWTTMARNASPSRIKDLATGELLPDEIPGTLSSLVWVAGDKGLVYSLANEQWRTDNARLHWLGQPLERGCRALP